MGDEVSHLAIPAGKAFVWLADVDAVTEPVALAEYQSLLSEEELRRYQAFHFDTDRHLYLVAHALLRLSLSRYADVPPQAWRFATEEFGRPKVASDQCPSRELRFNLTHTRGLAACAITRAVDIGIDVEWLDRRTDSDSIAQRYFATQEMKQLAMLSDEAREKRFLEYWTLKEAYVKARGGGLSIPLNSFQFYLDVNGEWRIAFTDKTNHSDEWQFLCLQPLPRHVMSVAIHRHDERNYEVDVCEAMPVRSLGKDR